MKLLNSTIGLKALMAATGIILIGFVLIHMLGNLQIFLPDAADGAIPIDEYGKLLKSNAGVLWGARLTLLASIGAHIYSAVALTQRSRAAPPELRSTQVDGVNIRRSNHAMGRCHPYSVCGIPLTSLYGRTRKCSIQRTRIRKDQG